VLIDTRRRHTSPTANLTTREREVLCMVVEGSPNKTIAHRLNITERTVKTHLTTIYQKLGVTDRQQAIHWAQQQQKPV
jgi:DNA-binding NarL/FixJ family response regulator